MHDVPLTLPDAVPQPQGGGDYTRRPSAVSHGQEGALARDGSAAYPPDAEVREHTDDDVTLPGTDAPPAGSALPAPARDMLDATRDTRNASPRERAEAAVFLLLAAARVLPLFATPWRGPASDASAEHPIPEVQACSVDRTRVAREALAALDAALALGSRAEHFVDILAELTDIAQENEARGDVVPEPELTEARVRELAREEVRALWVEAAVR